MSLRLGGISLLAMAIATPATAQTAPSEERDGLGDIVVTAQRRSERLQDVPVAVTALDAGQLSAKGISDTQDLGARVPGLNFQTAGLSRPRVFIRGLGSIQSDANSDSSVGIFVDDVYLSGFGNFNLDLFDVNRIEVLRGPQGALFGRNTAAGAISVTTLAPSSELTARLEASAGNYDQRQLRGTVSGPLSGKVLARASFNYRHRDGYTRDEFTGQRLNGIDNYSGRLALTFLLSDSFKASLSFIATRDRPDPWGQEPITAALFQVPAALAPGFARSSNVFSERYSTVGYQRRESYLGTLRLDLVTDWATLSSITAYQTYHLQELADFDSSAARSLDRGADERHPAFSQEFRITSAATRDDRISFIAGAFYMHESPQRLERFLFGPDNAVSRGPNRGLAFEVDDNSDLTIDSLAFYGQATLRLNSLLSVTGGLRYSVDDKQNDRTLTQSGFVGAVNPNLPQGPYFQTTKASWNSLDPELTINLRPSRDFLIYGSYREGFKSGGFQPAAAGTRVVASATFSPEEVRSFELGFKSTFFGSKVRLNAAAFDNRYDNLQLLSGNASAPGQTAVINNAASAKAQGFEIELAARPVRDLDLDLSYAYVDGTFSTFLESVAGPAGSAVFDRTGNQLPRQPRHALNLGGSYGIDLGSFARVDFRADWSLVSKTFFDASNSAPFVQPSYSTLNLRASITSADERWQFSVFGRNVTDERYLTNTTSLAGATVGLATYAPPALYGASLSFKLGR